MPAQGRYANLKRCIIDRFGDSEQKQIKKLLSDVDLGDRRPTQLLHELSGLAKDKVGDEFLKSLWLQRLPPQVRAILQTSTGSLQELAKLADKILEVGEYGSVASVESNPVLDISKRISRIEKRLDEWTRRSLSRAGRPSRRRSETPVRVSGDLCWYHARFGAKAKKCREPCKFTSAPKN